MRACRPNADGHVERGGVKIHYEVYGEGRPTILLMPTWTIVHKRFWKMQVPYLSRHFRVVCYDGPGNGGSDRPVRSEAYEQEAQVAYALAVLDASGTDAAIVVGLSRAANWALGLAAEQPARVSGVIVVSPALSLGVLEARHTGLDRPAPKLAPSQVSFGGTDPSSHWAKYNRQYWMDDFDDHLWFFLGQCFSEPHSTKAIEDGVAWGRETTGAVLVAESRAQRPTEEIIKGWCTRISCPVLAIHGDDDHLVPLERSERVVVMTGGELVVLGGAGHIPLARDPVRVNLLIKDFVDRVGS